MDAIDSSAIQALGTADDIAAARTRLMAWREAIDQQFPGDLAFTIVGDRLAAAITARAIALGLESV